MGGFLSRFKVCVCCRTCCKKEAWIKCSVRSVGRPVEKYGVERYKKNSKKVCRQQRGRKVSEMSDIRACLSLLRCKPTCHDVGPCDYPLPYWVVNNPTM